VKPDSQLRNLELLLYIPLDKSWGAQLPSWLKEENRQIWMMQEMNRKCNETKNTSANNRDRVRVREKAIANTRDLFRGLSTKLYVPAFIAWRIFTIHNGISTKDYKVYRRPGVHNFNLQSFTQEVAQSQW